MIHLKIRSTEETDDMEYQERLLYYDFYTLVNSGLIG
jgi:hypothetical protein